MPRTILTLPLQALCVATMSDVEVSRGRRHHMPGVWAREQLCAQSWTWRLGSQEVLCCVETLRDVEEMQSPSHTVVHKATVRADARIKSLAVGTMQPGQHVSVLETTKQDGHIRALVGPGQWISSRTKLGRDLLVPFAPQAAVYTVRLHTSSRAGGRPTGAPVLLTAAPVPAAGRQQNSRQKRVVGEVEGGDGAGTRGHDRCSGRDPARRAPPCTDREQGVGLAQDSERLDTCNRSRHCDRRVCRASRGGGRCRAAVPDCGHDDSCAVVRLDSGRGGGAATATRNAHCVRSACSRFCCYARHNRSSGPATGRRCSTTARRLSRTADQPGCSRASVHYGGERNCAGWTFGL
jgi:hypothetical protein